jgi:hypothetical protein
MEAQAYPKIALLEPRASSHNLGIGLAIGLSFSISAALWVVGKPQLLRIALPAMAALVGLLLYATRPITYVSYSLWVWFIAPFVRRLVDWHFGFIEPNFVLLTPFLVSGISVLTLLPSHRIVKTRTPIAFVLCGAAILYGFVIGMTIHRSADVLFSLLNWLCPLLFGLHLYFHWPQYQEYKSAISRTLLWAVLILGVYGVYQFFLPPAWDRDWLYNVITTSPSFGLPEPLQVRVFSTVNSPGPFANVMMAGLLLSFAINSPIKLPASIVGYLSFLLSSVRTAWLSWVVGLLWILKSAKPRILVRLILSAVLLIACLVPLASDPRMATVIGDRFNTFTDLGHDESYGARLELYRQLLSDAFDHPFGYGLKTLDMTHAKVDSGLFALIFSLGWLGAAFFAIGVCFILFANMPSFGTSDTFLSAAKAIAVAILAQIVSGPVFVSVIAVLFWMFAGMYLSGAQYYGNQSTLPAPADASVV